MNAVSMRPESEAMVAEYRERWGASDYMARVMLALYACGMVEMDSPEDYPETASDLYKYLIHYGLDLCAFDWGE